ncbi:GNAT family N-acetyltransferase [Rhodovibrionaceae bacterium A322]
MQVQWCGFSDFSLESLYGLMKLRQDVFILEQRSFYSDLDGLDQQARHLLLYLEQDLVGALRLIAEQEGLVKISRVVMARQARGTGLGKVMMQAALEEAEKRWPGRPQYLSSQEVQIPFYQRLGFQAEGDPYDDGGISHRDMWRGR